MSFVVDMATGLAGVFRNMMLRTLAAGLETNPATLAIVVGAVTVIMISGCWASSIAESRRHSPVLHFLAGMVIPVVYPVVLLFAMDVKRRKPAAAAEQPVRRTLTGDVADSEDAAPRPAPAAAEPESLPGAYNQMYFEKLLADGVSRSSGPWTVVYGENTVTVLQFVEPLPQAVVVEFAGRDGDRRRMRIPYNQIESVTGS